MRQGAVLEMDTVMTPVTTRQRPMHCEAENVSPKIRQAHAMVPAGCSTRIREVFHASRCGRTLVINNYPAT